LVSDQTVGVTVRIEEMFSLMVEQCCMARNAPGTIIEYLSNPTASYVLREATEILYDEISFELRADC
jgi:hypothetical protein